MLIQNGKLLLDDDFVYRDLRIEGDRIAEILPFGSNPREGEKTLDAYGFVITPGFIDLEVHGALGHDFSDGTGRASRSSPSPCCGRGSPLS